MIKALPFPKRILFVRLDRMGDVVLSMPTIRAARRQWPEAFIGMAVSLPCFDIIADAPELDAAFAYNRIGAHRSVFGTWKFAREIASCRFDTAVVLHPSNRSHWIPFLAGIPNRVGYDRKMDVLLTRRIPHNKQQGELSEAEYTLQMLRPFGINPQLPELELRVSERAVQLVLAKLSSAGLDARPFVVIHPSASCPSKRWPVASFAAVADLLMESGIPVVLVGGLGEIGIALAVMETMRNKAINFVGELSVAELMALLKLSRVLLSNDSGPVHLAAGVGTPVVSIFGRNQAGLSPRRWGPLGEGHRLLHKDVGCDVCLAHNCEIGFKCLTELSVDEVYAACQELWQKSV